MQHALRLNAAAGFLAALAALHPVLAQQPAAAPLFLKVDWVRPASQEDTKIRYMPVQANVKDPNVEMKFYGASAKQILTTGTPGSDVTPYGVWTGTAEGPFAVTFKLKNNLADLTGLANIRWFTKTSGFHVVRPVVKLAKLPQMIFDMARSRQQSPRPRQLRESHSTGSTNC